LVAKKGWDIWKIGCDFGKHIEGGCQASLATAGGKMLQLFRGSSGMI